MWAITSGVFSKTQLLAATAPLDTPPARMAGREGNPMREDWSMKIPFLVFALAIALSSPAFAQKVSVEYAHQVAFSNF